MFALDASLLQSSLFRSISRLALFGTRIDIQYCEKQINHKSYNKGGNNRVNHSLEPRTRPDSLDN
jgi:hypothetical protein